MTKISASRSSEAFLALTGSASSIEKLSYHTSVEPVKTESEVKHRLRNQLKDVQFATMKDPTLYKMLVKTLDHHNEKKQHSGEFKPTVNDLRSFGVISPLSETVLSAG